MSEVTVNIVELISDHAIYSVGSIPEGLTDPVKDIKFYPMSASYNKGRQYEGSCYVVFFKGSSVRRIVPKSSVIDVGVEVLTKENHNKKSPEEVGVAVNSETD
jgi:hypothetical protein